MTTIDANNDRKNGGLQVKDRWRRRHVPPSLARVISQLSTLICDLAAPLMSKASDDPRSAPLLPEPELAVSITTESTAPLTVLADLLLESFASATSDEAEDNPRL